MGARRQTREVLSGVTGLSPARKPGPSMRFAHASVAAAPWN